MSTFTQILYQIVFTTKFRQKTMTKDGWGQLHGYIAGLLQNKKCHPYQVGGVEDHLHIVTCIHPTVALAQLVQDIKLATISHIKSTGLFEKFNGWQEGYGAFTYSIKDKQKLVQYVLNQEEHHKNVDQLDEYKQLLRENDIPFEDRFLL